MLTPTGSDPQGLFRPLKACGIDHLDWRPQDVDDSAYFARNPDVAYRVREWRISDDRGFDEVNLYDMAAATIVFRAGCRLPRFYAPKTRSPRPTACAEAERYLLRCPAFGIDGAHAPASLAS